MTKLFHNWDFWGGVGATASIILPFLESSLPFIQWLGAVGGLVLLYYSIRNKRLEYKHLKGKNGKHK